MSVMAGTVGLQGTMPGIVARNLNPCVAALFSHWCSSVIDITDLGIANTRVVWLTFSLIIRCHQADVYRDAGLILQQRLLSM